MPPLLVRNLRHFRQHDFFDFRVDFSLPKLQKPPYPWILRRQVQSLPAKGIYNVAVIRQEIQHIYRYERISLEDNLFEIRVVRHTQKSDS